MLSAFKIYHNRRILAWYLTCMAYGIDPKNPPKMEKVPVGMRKHLRKRAIFSINILGILLKILNDKM